MNVVWNICSNNNIGGGLRTLQQKCRFLNYWIQQIMLHFKGNFTAKAKTFFVNPRCHLYILIFSCSVLELLALKLFAFSSAQWNLMILPLWRSKHWQCTFEKFMAIFFPESMALFSKGNLQTLLWAVSCRTILPLSDKLNVYYSEILHKQGYIPSNIIIYLLHWERNSNDKRLWAATFNCCL